MTDAQSHRLRQFFAAWFHQDWMVEADTPDGIVENYAYQMNDRAELPELSDAILAFIDEYPDDDALADALFRRMGCYYAPKALGQSTKAWLLHVVEKVREEEAKRQADLARYR
jgi:hypothetical protein